MKNKKAVLIFALAIIGMLSANGQIQKGRMNIGSTLTGGFNKSKDVSLLYNTYNDTIFIPYNRTTDKTIWRININPSFEYFFKNNMSVGVGFGYIINQTRSIVSFDEYYVIGYSNINTYESYIPQIFINKYWFISPKFSFKIKPTISSFYNENTSYHYIDNEAFPEDKRAYTQISTNWYHTIHCPIGINYFIANKWMLGLQSNLFQYKYEQNNQSFDFYGSNIGLTLAINYFIKLKPKP